MIFKIYKNIGDLEDSGPTLPFLYSFQFNSSMTLFNLVHV